MCWRRPIAVVVLIACVLGLAILSGCSTAPRDSGIRGTVTIGPVSPVARPGEAGTRPYEAALLISRPGERDVTVSSGADGRFQVPLAPGTYTILSARSASTPPTLKPVTVTVEPHAFSSVTVEFDSTLR